MWRAVKLTRPARLVSRRPGRAVRDRQRGFSHPVLFEALEDRLALDAAPTAPSGVNGTTGALVGANPGNFSPANTTGSVVAPQAAALDNQQVAFNTPYWLPNDRVPLTPPSPDQVPANFNQAANTPQGIRTFTFGPDTGTHFSPPAPTLTVRRPFIEDTGRHWVAQSEVDNSLFFDGIVATEQTGSNHGELTAIGSPNRVALLDEHAPIDRQAADSSSTSKSEFKGANQSVHLQASAVDRLMADETESDTPKADAAISELADGSSASEPGTGLLTHALVVSVASVMSVPIREHTWDKVDAWRRGRIRHATRW